MITNDNVKWITLSVPIPSLLGYLVATTTIDELSMDLLLHEVLHHIDPGAVVDLLTYTVQCS